MSKAVLSLREHVSKDGTQSIVIAVTHKSKQFRLSTKQSCTIDQWESKKGRGIQIANILLGKIQLILDNLMLEGRLGDISSDELRIMCDQALGFGEAPRKRLLFAPLLRSFSDKKVAQKTKEVYLSTLSKIDQYSNISKLQITDIDRKWLEDFDAWMREDGLSTNSRGIHMRNIRAVFNEAIKDEIITSYPFRQFKIRKEETRHRTLTVDQLRKLKDLKIQDKQKAMYRDLFLLDFYLIGINSIDLFNATKDQLVNGRLEYRRSKTGRLYSIKVEPEAMEIINRYNGRRHLLRVKEKYQDIHDFNRRWRDGLRTIGTGSSRGVKATCEAALPKEVTPYWARHSWATIAFNDAHIDKDTISLALGHSFGVAVTDIYISFSSRIVDEANRKVIDSIFAL